MKNITTPSSLALMPGLEAAWQLARPLGDEPDVDIAHTWFGRVIAIPRSRYG